MKTLLATTAAIVLASSSAFAYDSSSIDDQEFYSGIEGSSLVTAAASLSDNLYTEGNFVNVEKSPSIEGEIISNSVNDTNLFTEGNYDV